MLRQFQFGAIIIFGMVLMACQSMPTTHTHQQHHQTPISQKQFDITGKIGITTPQQVSSAFYVWGQRGEAFSIELTGALGLGAMQIQYNGKTASLNSEKTGLIEADNAEALLFQTTGLQAPIAPLSDWILGRLTDGDYDIKTDDHQRPIQIHHQNWTADLQYDKTSKPNKIKAYHSDGYQVVMTISHLNPQ